MRIFCLSFLALMAHVLWGQPHTMQGKNLTFTRLPDHPGLSESSINDILQDREGYLWVATWSGLVRYDGYSSTVFHSGNGKGDLKSNLISCLFEDSDGNIWVGTHMGGLFRYEHSTGGFVNYAHDPAVPGSISDNNIWKITEDRDGNLWVGTEHGLNVIDRKTGSFEHFYHEAGNPNSLSADFVTDILISDDQSLWVASDRGLNHLVRTGSGFEVQRYQDPRSDDAHNFIYKIAEQKSKESNEIWFITKKGVKCLRNGQITNYLADDKPANFSLFRAMLRIPGTESSLLLGSAIGLSFFDTATKDFKKHISDLDVLTRAQGQSVAVTALYIDRGGVLWVGTKKGLYKCDSYQNDFDLFLTSTFDVTNSIITGIRSAETGYWISTIGGGIFHFCDGHFDRYDISVAKKNDFAPFVQALLTDRDGNVWVGTAGAGIIRFDGKKAISQKKVGAVRHFHLNSTPAISDDYIVSFEEDANGNIWAGTWNGTLIRISPDGTVREIHRRNFERFPLVTLRSDRNGALWVGTRGNGLFRFQPQNERPEEMTHFHYMPARPGTIVNNYINAVYETASGELLIATEGGLLTFDPANEQFSRIDVKDGPGNGVVVGVLEDQYSNLWSSHWNGITVVDRNTADSRDAITQVVVHGGFYYNNVCFKDRNGMLLFGGSSGLNIINPVQRISNPGVSNVVLSEFRLFNEPVKHGADFKGRRILDVPVQDVSRIELRHDENTISFAFAALDFAAPEKIRYAYRLKGFEDGWNYTDADRRFANYTNLTNGTYTFIVKATNNNGEWGSGTREIAIIVNPPWWKTNWAYGSYFLATLVLLIAFRKLILIRANFIHDLKVERLQRENGEKLNQAKLEFFTNISHEFRTPLTLILGPLHQLLLNPKSDDVSTKLDVINRNAQRLLRLVNELLDFRKVESGHLKLTVREYDIVAFVAEISNTFEPLAREMKIKMLCSSPAFTALVYFDPIQFEKVLFNLLSNAFKHTPEGGEIRIGIDACESDVVLTVSNNGDIIRTEHYEKIFQSFFSFDEERHRPGTGIGLALVRSLVCAHHGSINVSGADGKTIFTIRLKKGHAHFSPGEIAAEESYGLFDQTTTLTTDSTLPRQPEEKSVLVGSAKMLIVEDNAEVRSYIRTLFVNEFTILEASDGKAGLELAEAEDPEIILSDVMMPVMNGIQLCTAIRSNIRTSHIPVILLTARTSLVNKVEGLECGADDYVTKPFHPGILQLKVRNMLQARKLIRQKFQASGALAAAGSAGGLSGADEALLKRLAAHVEANIDSSIYSVEDLCREAGLSRMQLYRKLKALTGCSGNEFVRGIRLRRAAQLLGEGNLTVSEITYAVGFNDLQYFRECFRKMFGANPSDYLCDGANLEGQIKQESPAR